jgi:hypothetical protein
MNKKKYRYYELMAGSTKTAKRKGYRVNNRRNGTLFQDSRGPYLLKIIAYK